MIRPESFVFPFRFATTLGFYSRFNFSVLDVIQVALVVAGVFYLGLRFRQNRYRILLLWFLLPVLFLGVSKVPPSRHYFILLFPVQFIAVAIFADRVISVPKKKKALFGHVALGLVLAVLSAQLLCSFAFNNMLKESSHISWLGYGPPFRYRVEEIRGAMQRGYTEPEDVHEEILRNKPAGLRSKHDFLATKYIVENIDAISK